MLNIVNLHEDEQVKVFVGNKLKNYRMKKGISQSELGEILGVKNNSVSAYERGKRSMTLDQLKIAADYFNITVDDFFPRNEELFKKVDKLTDFELSHDEKEIVTHILEASLKIDKEKREDFLDKLDVLVQLYR